MTHPRLSPREAHTKLTQEGYVCIDVRTEAEFDTGHPEGAYNVPVKLPASQGGDENPKFVEIVLACFGQDARLVVTCGSGPRSLRAARLLVAAGMRDIVEQRAGFGGIRDAFGSTLEPGWKAEGLPTATEAEPGRSYEELCAKAGLSDDD